MLASWLLICCNPFLLILLLPTDAGDRVPVSACPAVLPCLSSEQWVVLSFVHLVQMNEPALLNTCHSVQVSRILKWRVARTYQADMLLKVRPVFSYVSFLH